MALPDALQRRFDRQVTRYEEENKMLLVSKMELRSRQEGELPWCYGC